MKIVVIHGQNHKGSTWNAANILLQGITCEKEVKEFFLPKDGPGFCVGYQVLPEFRGQNR